MTRIGFIGLLILLISINSKAQPNIDSLRLRMNSDGDYRQRIGAFLGYTSWFELKNFDSTILAANQGIELARNNGDSVSVALLKKSSGVASYFKGDFEVAAENYYAAVGILEKTPERKKLAEVYNEIAKIYRKTRDLDKALANYNRAESIFRQIKDSTGIATILNESGVVFEYRGDYEEAIRRYTASKDMAELRNDSLAVSYALSNIAGVYVIQQKYDAAEKNLLQVLAIRQALKDNFAIALSWSDLGVTMNAKGDYVKATNYLEQSNTIASSMHYPELLSNNYNELSAIAQKQGNYKKALEYFQLRTTLRDSLYSIDKTKQIEELNTRYETVKKQQKIDQQHDRIVRQNFLFMGLAGLVLLLALLAHSQYKRYRLRKETQLQAEIIKQQELSTKAVIEAEEKERQRIAKDLHDGVGQMMSAAKMNLSAFESDLKFEPPDQKQSFEKVIQLLDDSCREVRTVSHIMMPNVLLKNNLGVAIREFAEKIDTKALKVHVFTEGLDDRPEASIETVLYRIIQECVNNVIKHAGAATMDISVIRDKDGISATIEDNGKGFDTTDASKFDGMGLKNIITRVEYLKGTVDIDSTPGKGTLVAIHVPL